MTNLLRLVLVDPQDSSRDAIKAAVATIDSAWVVGECSRYEYLVDIVGQSQPEVAIIAVGTDPAAALRAIQSLRSEFPECRLIAVGNASDGALLLQVIRAGVRDFLPRPLQPADLAAALERIRHEWRPANESAERGCSVIAVAGATGGVGATSLAVNLGCILAADTQRSVALVDLDLALGDADVLLDVIPEYTLTDVAQNIARLDLTLLKRSLTRHRSGLYLLPRPVRLQDMTAVEPEAFQRILGLLKATFSHLIIDLSKSYSPLDWIALEAAQNILVVTQLDLPSLRNMVRLLLSFDLEKGWKDRCRIVVNRVGLEHPHIGIKKAEETMGRAVFAQIPNDYALMVDVRNNGVTLPEEAPEAPITKALLQLAERLVGPAQSPATQPAAESGANGWFRFWRSRGVTAAT